MAPLPRALGLIEFRIISTATLLEFNTVAKRNFQDGFVPITDPVFMNGQVFYQQWGRFGERTR